MSGVPDEACRSTGTASPGIRIAPPTIKDAPKIWRLAGACDELDLNSPYAYLLWCRDFVQTSAVAYIEDSLVGFVTGYMRPDATTTLMVWQVGVVQTVRRLGIGSSMIKSLLGGPVTHVEATVTDDNDASARLFTGLSRQLSAPLQTVILFPEPAFPTAHPAERLYRIGPIGARDGRR